MLASPQFLFRLEAAEPRRTARQGGTASPIVDLASRLSFFLWGTAPDAELMKVASQGRLSAPGMLDKQVKRMLADPRSEALATRFAAQWLRLNDVDQILPDAILYPYFDRTLGDSLIRETRAVLRQHRPRGPQRAGPADGGLHVRQRARRAKHYGIPNVTGDRVPPRRRCPSTARGLLGHGSMLLLTSVADRTSPVMRGKWIMEVLLGSPPPPPPPNVPALEETGAADGGKLLSVRERMEEHRKNPACASCHRVIDPLGLALENFDVTGRWRIKDSGKPVDATGGDVRRHQARRAGQPARGAAEPQGRLPRNVHREPDDVRARPPRSSTTTCRRSARSRATPAKNDHRISAFILGIVNSGAFQMTRSEVSETVAKRH